MSALVSALALALLHSLFWDQHEDREDTWQ